MSRRAILLIVSMILSAYASLAQYDFVYLEFKPYKEYFVNVDGKAYYSSASTAMITSIDTGMHILTLTPKDDPQNKTVLEMELRELPVHITITKSILGLEITSTSLQNTLVAEEGATLSDIIIKADTISYDNSDEDVDCRSYNSARMEIIINQFIEVGDKEKFLKRTFYDRCITRRQLKNLMDASLITKERFEVIEVLHDQVNGDFSLDDVSDYFEGTDYYSDYLRLKKENGE